MIKPFDSAAAQRNLKRRHTEHSERLKEKYAQATKDFDSIVDMIITGFRPLRVWQWGSLLQENHFTDRSDIDIGLEGVSDSYGRICDTAEKLTAFPLHIVDMDCVGSTFKELIAQTGKKIYDRNS